MLRPFVFVCWLPLEAARAMANLLSDVKSIGKCPDFSGNDGDWLNWKFRFEAWFILATADVSTTVDDLLKHAGASAQPLDEAEFNDPGRRAGNILYVALANLCRG